MINYEGAKMLYSCCSHLHIKVLKFSGCKVMCDGALCCEIQWYSMNIDDLERP